jgi:G3E family GTPase
VVDARHAMQQLDAHEEAQRQVGFADKILISKSDLAEPMQVDALTARIRRMNPRAPIQRSHFGDAPIDEVLDLRGFNLNDKLEIDPAFLGAEAEHACDPHCGHPDHAHGHGHGSHSDDIAAFTFKAEHPFDSAKLNEALGHLINVFGPRMLRYKGVVWMDGADRKVIFQGVHQTMGSDVGARWQEHEVRQSKMVFIGINLPQAIFMDSLKRCLV